MTIISVAYSMMKFSSKYKAWLICLLLLWVVGMLCTIFLMSLNGSKVEVQKSYLSYTVGSNKLPPATSFKMIRISKYCNFPNDFASSQEGQISGNFSLAMVAIVIRHGDRAPLQQVRNLSSIPCNSEKAFKNMLYIRFLKHMLALQKRENRDGPFKDFNFIPGEKCALSHLTRRGAYQHLTLGSTLSRIYNKKWKLLFKYHSYDQIDIYSTVFSRTYQSCLAFLYGFLPSFDLNRINITAAHNVHFNMRKEFAGCQTLGKLQSALAQKRSKMLESHPAVTRLFSYLHPIAVPNRTHTKHSSRSLLDSFMFYVCHSSQLPCSNQHCATFEQIRNVLAFNEWEGRQRVDDPIYVKFCWLQIYGLLVDIHQKMEDMIIGKPARRFALFSGHDVTLEPLLTILGISDGTNPPYASRLVFELYSSNEKNRLQTRHAIKILFNGRNMTKFVSFCKESSKDDWKVGKVSEEHCLFERMTQFVRSTFFKIMNAPSYSAACDIKSNLQDDDY